MAIVTTTSPHVSTVRFQLSQYRREKHRINWRPLLSFLQRTWMVIQNGTDHVENIAPHYYCCILLLLLNCCIRICCRSLYLVTAILQSLISQSFPNNGCEYHNTYINLKCFIDITIMIEIYLQLASSNALSNLKLRSRRLALQEFECVTLSRQQTGVVS